MKRTAVFIDGAYLDKVCEIHFNGVKVDYKLLVDEIKGSEELLRAYYYHCLPYLSQNPTEEEQERLRRKEGFFYAISKLPRFQIKLGKLAFRGITNFGKPIFIQKSIDVMMAVDMVQMSATRQIDHIIVIAADSDFIPAIRAVMENGVMTTVWFSKNGSPINSEFIDMFDNKHEITQAIVNRVTRYIP